MRPVGERADRADDRARDQEGDQAESEHDARVDEQGPPDHRDDGRERDLVGFLDDQGPAEA